VGEAIDIFRLSGMKYPIHILASTFSTVSDEVLHNKGSGKLLVVVEMLSLTQGETDIKFSSIIFSPPPEWLQGSGQSVTKTVTKL
jgi:hypothetical protein